ncbi:MAG: hypothetical protein I8H95_08070 [Rhodocyclales bacterium]|nr:hypothetical protein [Rhodocyclales bacterium]
MQSGAGPTLSRSEPDSRLSREGEDGGSGNTRRMRRAAATDWLCKASRGPHSEWEEAGLYAAFRVFH